MVDILNITIIIIMISMATPLTMTMPQTQAARTLLLKATRSFYRKHSDLIKESHGIIHAERVYNHACRAIESLTNTNTNTNTNSNSNSNSNSNTRRPLSTNEVLEIEVAALLHDVDDDKYFPNNTYTSSSSKHDNDNDIDIDIDIDNNKNKNDRQLRYYASLYPNAVELMKEAKIPESSYETILFMIDAVSCSKNGNSVPKRVSVNNNNNNNTRGDDDGDGDGDDENNDTHSNSNNNYHLLIPRWSDRIEAVGARGVWRCYQYNQEKKRPLCIQGVTPRPKSHEELWDLVVPERFEAYMSTEDGKTCDNSMIGHYYDKLLHVACPPGTIVSNEYLEEKLQDSAKELVEVCLRYGRTGVVDEEYIRSFKDS